MMVIKTVSFLEKHNWMQQHHHYLNRHNTITTTTG